MPDILRQELSIAGAAGAAAMRGTWHQPASPSAERLPGVLVHRGVPSADETSGDLIDALAAGFAEHGLAALRFEPRSADLLLDDFHRYTLADEVADVLAAMSVMAARPDVDQSRINLLGFGLGAIAASVAAGQSDQIASLALVAPVTGSHLSGRMLKSNGTPAVLGPQQAPAAWIAAAAGIDAPAVAAAARRPALIVHGAADRFIPPHVSNAYLAALQAAGVPVEHILVARADHSFSAPLARAAVVERVARFAASTALTAERKIAGALA
jgi:dienelactone hydrolase